MWSIRKEGGMEPRKGAEEEASINGEVVECLEQLLARKTQIKAELREIADTMEVFSFRVERAPDFLDDPEVLQTSDAQFTERMAGLEKREIELRGELFEISALTRSIPARRLKKWVSEVRVRELILDAGLMTNSTSLQEVFRASDCWTACEVCVTACNSECIACTECITSCATECITSCTSDCIACPVECVTLCTYGCSTPCTVGGATGVLYNLPATLDHSDKEISPNDLLEMVVKHQGVPDRIEIDWD